MTTGLHLYHVALIALVLPCMWFTLGEARHRALPPLRLYVPPLLAIACALAFLTIDVGARLPIWKSGVFAVAGFVLGGIQGLTLPLEVDHDARGVRLPRAIDSFLIALALLGAVLLEIASPADREAMLRQFASEIAAACAAMLTARALGIRVRWRNDALR